MPSINIACEKALHDNEPVNPQTSLVWNKAVNKLKALYDKWRNDGNGVHYIKAEGIKIALKELGLIP